MNRFQTPKIASRNVKFSYEEPEEGMARRISYQKTILEKAPVFPKPVEYSDIDKAVFEMLDNELDFAIDGKRIPTFTTYSSQRFSEYSQSWKYTDENGNLYKNFKTLSRDTAPTFGDSQGKNYNIPGERDYTLLLRTVVEDDGKECYECHSMKQPFAVNLVYSVNFVTNLMENINLFNEQLNNLFKSRQHYIRPNGHWMPLHLDEISDSTTYSINDMKIYVQTASIKCLAYIIREEDFTVKKYPKNTKIFDMNNLLTADHKPSVDIDEYNMENMRNESIDLNLSFPPYSDKTEFEFDTTMVVTEYETDNIRNIRLFINDEPIFSNNKFTLKEGDNVKVKIFPFLLNKESKITYKGYNPDVVYDKSKIEDFEINEPKRHETITVES